MITTTEYIKQVIVCLTLLSISALVSWIPTELNQQTADQGSLSTLLIILGGTVFFIASYTFLTTTKQRMKQYGISGWYSMSPLLVLLFGIIVQFATAFIPSFNGTVPDWALLNISVLWGTLVILVILFAIFAPVILESEANTKNQ